MKLKLLIKASPFLSTLLLIVILSITNQKEYTKLKILIWNTPTLTLGSYIAISTCSGFLLSYIITTNLATINQSIQKQSLKFRDETVYQNSDGDFEENNNRQNENTLIERDIKDPSPTINANFRIIGRTQRTNTNYIKNKNFQYDNPTQFDELSNNNEKSNNDSPISSDWNDESFSKW